MEGLVSLGFRWHGRVAEWTFHRSAASTWQMLMAAVFERLQSRATRSAQHEDEDQAASSNYLMESEQETQRLLEQAWALPVRGHLVSTGLKPGMAALDAGCGPGLITATWRTWWAPAAACVGLDMSDKRLAEARARAPACPLLASCRGCAEDCLPDSNLRLCLEPVSL